MSRHFQDLWKKLEEKRPELAHLGNDVQFVSMLRELVTAEVKSMDLQVGELRAAVTTCLNRMPRGVLSPDERTLVHGALDRSGGKEGLQKHDTNDQPFILSGQNKFDVDMKIDPVEGSFYWVDEKTGKPMRRISDGTVWKLNERGGS